MRIRGFLLKTITCFFLALATASASETVLRVEWSGFFPRPEGPTAYAVEIRDNGESVGKLRVRRGEASVSLGRLSEESMRGIRARVGQVQPGELVDHDPSAPVCPDAGSKTYFARANGVSISFFREAACHTYVLARSEISSLRRVLDGQLELLMLATQTRD